MGKRLAALALCILLTAGLSAPAARADAEVYFVAAGSNVLPLSDASMPFWSGGYLYVSSTIFTGLAWEALGVGYVAANERQPLILYSGGDKSLMFELGTTYARDAGGTRYYPGAVQRNGQTFVSAALVADYFGLEYSMIRDVEHGYLVWLRKAGFGLGERDFANAAVYAMTQRYEEYLRNREPSGSHSGESPFPVLPADGNGIFLAVAAGEQTGALLEVLDRQDAQAAFFCDLEFLETQGDLLRRMAARGHAIGLLAEVGEQPLAQQLSDGNEALYRATCTKTRLALVKDGDQETLTAAAEAGYYVFTPELDRSGSGLQSVAAADNLLQRIAARREDTTVWLGDAVNGNGLRAFLTVAGESGARCLALRETV